MAITPFLPPARANRLLKFQVGVYLSIPPTLDNKLARFVTLLRPDVIGRMYQESLDADQGLTAVTAEFMVRS